MNGVSVEIATQHNPADYGEDLPWEYTARVTKGSIEDAIALLENNLGGSEKFDAYNIEPKGEMVSFLSFAPAEVGNIFSIDTTIEVAKLKATENARITNELRRLMDRALLELVPCKQTYMRVYWWDRVHPDPDLAPLMDANGRHIEVGQRCFFRHEGTSEWVAARVVHISAHPERPVAVWKMNCLSTFGVGCHPTNLRIVADTESVVPVMEAVKEQVRYKLGSDGFKGDSGVISRDPELRALLAQSQAADWTVTALTM